MKEIICLSRFFLCRQFSLLRVFQFGLYTHVRDSLMKLSDYHFERSTSRVNHFHAGIPQKSVPMRGVIFQNFLELLEYLFAFENTIATMKSWLDKGNTKTIITKCVEILLFSCKKILLCFHCELQKLSCKPLPIICHVCWNLGTLGLTSQWPQWYYKQWL